VTYLCLANAGRLANRLGPSGLSVLTRLSAFVIVCLGAEISWSGLRALIASLGATG
jgi:multiple antibiotic resistance protein